jgi:excisionase family DNA binding protein
MDDTSTTRRLAYTVDEAAGSIGISRSQLYKLIAAGEIATVKIGSSRRITPDAIRDFLAAKAAS